MSRALAFIVVAVLVLGGTTGISAAPPGAEELIAQDQGEVVCDQVGYVVDAIRPQFDTYEDTKRMSSCLDLRPGADGLSTKVACNWVNDDRWYDAHDDVKMPKRGTMHVVCNSFTTKLQQDLLATIKREDISLWDAEGKRHRAREEFDEAGSYFVEELYLTGKADDVLHFAFWVREDIPLPAVLEMPFEDHSSVGGDQDFDALFVLEQLAPYYGPGVVDDDFEDDEDVDV